MRRSLTIVGTCLGLGLFLSACDMIDSKDAVGESPLPTGEAAVIGTWRTSIPVGSEPPMDMQLIMKIESSHTMLTTLRMATGLPSPQDSVDVMKEHWTWKIVDGTVVSEKTECEYMDPQTMQPTGETGCRAPKSKTKAINVNAKGDAWTVVDEGQVFVFHKG